MKPMVDKAFRKGLANGLPIAILLWMAIIALVWLLVGCAAEQEPKGYVVEQSPWPKCEWKWSDCDEPDLRSTSE